MFGLFFQFLHSLNILFKAHFTFVVKMTFFNFLFVDIGFFGKMLKQCYSKTWIIDSWFRFYSALHFTVSSRIYCTFAVMEFTLWNAVLFTHYFPFKVSKVIFPLINLFKICVGYIIYFFLKFLLNYTIIILQCLCSSQITF